MTATAGSAAVREIRDDTVFLQIDETVYTREALLRTCYWFTDQAYVYIRREGSCFEVQLSRKVNVPTLDMPVLAKLDDLAGEFLNSLLDYQLRCDIEKETATIRELLVAKAFAASGALDDEPPGDPRDPVAQESTPLVQLVTGSVA